MEQSHLLFLGTGGSMGIPIIGCSCVVCRSRDPHDRRLRPSALLKIGQKRILIDVTPDFRQQALHYSIQRIDGLLMTHHHFDHVGGLDDLRAYYFIHKERISCYLSDETFEDVKMRFNYIIRPLQEGASVCAQLDFNLLKEAEGEFVCAGVPIRYFSFHQPGAKVTGYRIGTLAYITDIRSYDDQIFDHLKGVETLVLSALRWTVSPMHFSVDEAIAFARKVGAKKTYFTHVAHELGHQATMAKLPEGFFMSYDGLEIPFQTRFS